ncbi:hypothetical protein [Nonomuraea zeae]|uniref:hypothetical protein n=1 Tax=Nonomuraea zeae TaxID=1642303 RepID=UPI0014783DAE|nr:hypothetical protein [Nonomuraea zeae]
MPDHAPSRLRGPASKKPSPEPPRARDHAAPAAPPSSLARELARTIPPAAEPGRAAPTEVVDLAGSGTFTPPEPVAAYLDRQGDEGGQVNVRLGSLARGRLHVKKAADGYSTGTAHQPLSLSIPVLDPLRSANLEPVLAVRISDGVVEGYASVHTGEQTQPAVNALGEAISEHSAALGWLGLDRLRLPKPVNKLEGGVLTFEVPELTFSLGGFLDGAGRFGIVNEQVTFEATARGTVSGLGTVELPIRRGPDGLLAGSIRIALSLPKFSGEVLAAFAAGVVDVSGTVQYTTEKLSGELTLVATDAETAKGLARARLGLDQPAAGAAPEAAPEAASGAAPGAAPAGPASAAGPKPGPRVLAGWGELDFRFTDWLTGKARVIVDATPHVTVVGEITPQKTVELFPQRDVVRPLPALEARALYGVPLVGNVFIFVGVRLEALAKLGPGTLRDIRVLGTYSTDPEVGKDFSIAGTLNISAFAGLRLRGEGGAGVQILDHDIKAGVGLSALAGVRGYVEATPTIGYREVGDPAAGKKGEFFLKGHLELAAQPFLGLDGDLFVELDSPWWSPAPDKRWTWPVGQLEYPLPGQFGIGADVDYVVGSGKFPDITFSPVEFSPDRFMTDLLEDHVPAKSKGEQETKGTWQEGGAPAAGAPAPAASASGRPAAGSPAGAAPSAGPPGAGAPAARGGPQRKDPKVAAPARPGAPAPGTPARPGAPGRPGTPASPRRAGKPASSGPSAPSGPAKGRKPAKGRQEKADGNVPRPEIQKRWADGMQAVGELVRRSHTSPLTDSDIDAALKSIRRKHGFKQLRAERVGEHWHIYAEMNPSNANNPAVADAAPSTAKLPKALHSLHSGMRIKIAGEDEGWLRSLFRKNGAWMASYLPPSRSGPEKVAPALTSEGEANIVRVHGEEIKIEKSVKGGKADWVRASPLRPTRYQRPGEDPVGWDQLKARSKDFWVRAHLLHGALGGPGSTWNLVPATKSVNIQMFHGHEKSLKEKAASERISFEAKVSYHEDLPGTGVKKPSGFPRMIDVSWHYLDTGVKDSKSYPVRPPRSNELRPKSRKGEPDGKGNGAEPEGEQQ